jgi:predicted PurR-regulated permease PerM
MKSKQDETAASSVELTFQKRVWIAVSIFAFVTVLLLFIYASFNAFLLVLAGILIAVYFRGLASAIKRKTKWKESVCLGISIFSTILILVGLFWLIGAKVQEQFAELVEMLPQTIEKVKEKLSASSIGKLVTDEASSEEAMDKAKEFMPEFFKSTFGVFGDLYVVFFIGIFFTVSPYVYINGFVQLVPVKGQNKAFQLFDILGGQLAQWLKGTFLSMFIVFILTSIGLAIIGMPLWLVLGLLAGLICFIPNFGPLLSMIPAILVALSQSPQLALWVIGLYLIIQFVESNFITTAIQKKMINMPPALILIAQLFMGVLTGLWGLIMATPLTLIMIILVEELYIKEREKSAEQATIDK